VKQKKKNYSGEVLYILAVVEYKIYEIISINIAICTPECCTLANQKIIYGHYEVKG
jgi:hypothetical protein